MTAVKKTQQSTGRNKREMRANRRNKGARKAHKRITFQRTGDGGPGGPTDGTSLK